MAEIIGIDLGGTNIRGGVVADNSLSTVVSERINSQGTVDNVMQQLFGLVDQLISPSVKAIGIGVPGLVDAENGIVYDVVNIRSWKQVALRQLVQEHYQLPVFINNDANCFALGEFYFGKGKGYTSMIGLTIGTGLGGGVIINEKLYEGTNGGAGEFGMIDYLDKYFEYYASGQFFQNVYKTDGATVFERAGHGDKEALRMYDEMGTHFGNVVRTILYAFDVELIVLGGSVRHAFKFFSNAMWQRLNTFVFQKAIKNLKVEVSELENSGLLGAAALYYNYEEETS